MTPEQIALVQESFATLEARADELTRHFYDHLFDLDPGARGLFSVDLDTQRLKFFEELGEIVRSIGDLSSFVDRASVLGARHADYGVRTGQYATAGQALIAALRDTAADAMTPDAIDAWLLAYNLVAETMMRGATSDPPVTP